MTDSPEFGAEHPLSPPRTQLAFKGFGRSVSIIGESYTLQTDFIVRTIRLRDGSEVESRVPRARVRDESSDINAHDLFDASWLRSKHLPLPSGTRHLKVADLFSGCGGLSLGVSEACRALGMRARFVFASDTNQQALDVYRMNFAPVESSARPIEELIDGEIGAKLSSEERGLRSRVGDINLIVAGPPCQGHSDLNNHTRRDDPKNQLILRVVRFAEIFRPAHVLIENVQGIKHDRTGALKAAKRALGYLGYELSERILRADYVGAAQARRRYFMIASSVGLHSLEDLPELFASQPRPMGWAIDDLTNASSSGTFDTAANHSAENKRRIDYLFDHKLHELPDSQRPKCHADGNHRYQAVYGRMYWDRASPTITTGFGSTGQGRFVHPKERRTLTPHEAARLQFFPDFFDFGERGRRDYQELIGNAVPSKLAYAAVLHQLG
jgi:DNA (cytosine-5)-methyltransferase 1